MLHSQSGFGNQPRLFSFLYTGLAITEGAMIHRTADHIDEQTYLTHR